MDHCCSAWRDARCSWKCHKCCASVLLHEVGGACALSLFLSSSAARYLLCGAGLAHLGRELVQVFLRFFLSVEERFEEFSLRGRQGLRPHGRGLDVFLQRFGFLKGVLLAFLLEKAPRLFLSFTRLGEGVHGLIGRIALCLRCRVLRVFS